jgi:hypothetical protein
MEKGFRGEDIFHIPISTYFFLNGMASWVFD